jgi:hypothetical protein
MANNRLQESDLHQPAEPMIRQLCALYGMKAHFKAKIGAGMPDTGLPAALPSGLVILRPRARPDHHAGLPHACTAVTADP